MVDYKKKFNQAYKSFVEVIESEIKDIVGETDDIEISCGDERIHIYCANCSIGTMMVSGNKFYLASPFGRGEYGFESLDFFRVYVKEFILKHVKPSIIDLYKGGTLTSLPSKMSYEFKFDINKLNSDWFIDKFSELSPNSETAENVTFIDEDGGNLRIKFDIDCGRYGYWKGQVIRINERGDVRVDISDCPMEGNGLDDELEEAIIEQMKL